jgi:hypothetical protein
MSDWIKLFDRDTPAAALPAIIEQQTHIALEALSEALAADASSSPQERAVMLARAEPLIYEQTRHTIETAWRRLREDESTPVDKRVVPVIH